MERDGGDIEHVDSDSRTSDGAVKMPNEKNIATPHLSTLFQPSRVETDQHDNERRMNSDSNCEDRMPVIDP